MSDERSTDRMGAPPRPLPGPSPGLSQSRPGWLQSLSTLFLYLGFAGTGVGMALPGSVLPVLAAHWRLVDRDAGLLFFLAWSGTSVGALLVRPSRSFSLGLGAAILACGALGMAYAGRWGAFVFMPLYGIGLGLTMTAVSLLQAGRHPERRGAELNRLNLVWAVGASLCPALAGPALRTNNASGIFSIVAGLFACLAAWAWTMERDPLRAVPIQAPQPARSHRFRWETFALWPLPLMVAMLFPTGIEASMGAWIAAYVQRSQHAVAVTVTAGSCFWAGLMLSRTLWAILLSHRPWERWVMRKSLLTVVLGAGLLLVSGTPAVILAGIFLVGFGLGPIYPLLLAIALPYSENTLIFFVAGVGSAIFPWLTGIVSSSAGSLRVGLIVPSAAAVALLGIGWRLTGKRDRSAQDAA